MSTATNDLITAKNALSAMASTEPTLAATFTTSGTLNAGVYDAASWSTTDGTTLTLDANNVSGAEWVFNIVDILAFGANTTVEVINDTFDNAEVWWNVSTDASPGGYASTGDGAIVVGTIIAEDYVMIGANAHVSAASTFGESCGGVYLTTSYVSIGANAQVSGGTCSTPPQTVDVPEPETNTLLLAGLGLMGFIKRRRSKKAA